MKQKLVYLSLLLATAFTGIAQTSGIDGYFRVKTAAGGYMAVKGSFTANANLTDKELRTAPGSLFYITAAAAGDGSYVLGNLGAQGIDLAKDEYKPDFSEGGNGFADLLMGALDASNPLYGMVQQGYRYGYTSVARATLGTVFGFVSGKLENYGSKLDGLNINGFEYGTFTPNEFNEVTNEFNRDVVAPLDMHLHMSFDDASTDDVDLWNIYVDMPDFGKVADWYTGLKAAGDYRFTKAMLAMNYWLLHGRDNEYDPANFEEGMYFVQSDIDDLKKWGYDYVALCNPEVLEDEGKSYYKYTFDQVFSDKALLFNWIKLMAYRIINPETDTEGVYSSILGQTGDMDIAGLMKEHAITRFIYEQFEAFQPDSRIFFVAGNVVDGKLNPENEHLGFAIGDAALATAANYGKWQLVPVQKNDTVVELKLPAKEPERKIIVKNDTTIIPAKYHGAAIYDFPVTLADKKAKFLAGELKTFRDECHPDWAVWEEHHYLELTEIEGGVAAQEPFIVESPTNVVKLALNYDNTYEVEKPAKRPDNSFVVSDDEVTSMHVAKRRRAAASQTSGLKGTLLATAPENLQGTWGDDNQSNVYRLTNPAPYVNTLTGVSQTSTNNGFVLDKNATTNANEAVYTTPTDTKLSQDQVLLAQPTYAYDAGAQTGVADVVIENPVAGAVYDLQGKRVARPERGQVYIIDGKKLYFF